MKLPFDQNLGHRRPGRPADLYPGSAQVRRLGLARASGMTIREHAKQGHSAVVTRDVDRAEIATLRGAPPLVIWLRAGNSSTAAVESALRAAHEGILDAEEDGTAVIEVRW